MKRTPCSVALEAEGWHATDAVRAGPYVVGIRTSDEATRAAVHTRFESLLDPVNGGRRQLLSASRHPRGARADRAAGSGLRRLLAGRPPPDDDSSDRPSWPASCRRPRPSSDTDRPWFLGSVVIVDGAAVLAPGWLWPAWTAMASRLRDQRVRLLGRSVALDTDTGEAVLPALPRMREPFVTDDATEQRFPIRRWLLLGTPPAGRPSPGARPGTGRQLRREHAGHRAGASAVRPRIARRPGRVPVRTVRAEHRHGPGTPRLRRSVDGGLRGRW